MPLDNYISFVIVAFFTIVSPGPAILVAINNGLKYNVEALFFSTLGNALGLLTLAIASVLGVSALFAISAIFFTMFKVIGAIYLIYLGINQIRNRDKDIILNAKDTNSKPDYFKLFKTSYLVAVTNPKPIIFFSTILPLFVSNVNSHIIEFIIMIATFITISFFSLMSYGFVASKSGKLLKKKNYLKNFFTASGLIFITMGLAMFFMEQKENR